MPRGSLVVTAPDGVHLLTLASGKETWTGAPAQAVGAVRSPVIVGSNVDVVGRGGLVALAAP